MDEGTDSAESAPTPTVEQALDTLWRAQQRVMQLHTQVEEVLEPERQRLLTRYRTQTAQGPVEGDDLLLSWGRLYGDLCTVLADLAEQHVAMSTALFEASMAYTQQIQETGAALVIPVLPCPPPYLN